MRDPADLYAREFLCTMFDAGIPTPVAYMELVKDASVRAIAGEQVDRMSAQPLFESGRAFAHKLAKSST
jgi:hypothetical protein